jgi:chaperonin cofactor prefoldin
MLTPFRLVLETLEPLPGDRKCFRMINGVLTERTVKEVVPILKTNSDGLKKALDELVKQYKSKQDEMEKWKVCPPAVVLPPPSQLRLPTQWSRCQRMR